MNDMTDDEKDRALCEAHCNSAADEYFNPRPQLDSAINRRIFYAGHRKAWLQQAEATAPLLARIAELEQANEAFAQRQEWWNKRMVEMEQKLSAAPATQPEPMTGELATCVALLEDWVTSFVDSIEGGNADELVAATRSAIRRHHGIKEQEMTDNIKLPPFPEGMCLREDIEDYAREAVRLNAQAAPDALEKELLQAIQERDAAEDYIDALLDEVLGTDRPEWSSTYGHADAIEQVREMMGALMKPCVDKAWGRFQSAQAAPAAPQPAPVEQTDARDAARWRYIAWHIGVAWNEQGFTSLVRIVSDKHREMLGDMVDRMMAGDWPEAAPQPAQQYDDEGDALTIAYLHGHGKGKDSVQPVLSEKDALLRQALEALEGFANITNDSQGVKGYHLNGDIAEWDEFDEVDAASSTIEAIRNHLGVKT